MRDARRPKGATATAALAARIAIRVFSMYVLAANHPHTETIGEPLTPVGSKVPEWARRKTQDLGVKAKVQRVCWNRV